MLEAKNVFLFRQNRCILQDISFDVKPKDLITIIGPNGAGKSTLLKCLMGIIKPSSGKIIAKNNLKISYIPQSFSVDHIIPITVKGFIKLYKKTTTAKIIELANEMNIAHILNKKMYHLSGGEIQRVLLVRSLINSPDILILDEANQNLDIAGQVNFYNLIEQVWDKHKLAIIMVSHDLNIVMARSQKVICLNNRICCSGKPSQIINDPSFVSLFGVDSNATLALYNHHHSE